MTTKVSTFRKYKQYLFWLIFKQFIRIFFFGTKYDESKLINKYAKKSNLNNFLVKWKLRKVSYLVHIYFKRRWTIKRIAICFANDINSLYWKKPLMQWKTTIDCNVCVLGTNDIDNIFRHKSKFNFFKIEILTYETCQRFYLSIITFNLKWANNDTISRWIRILMIWEHLAKRISRKMFTCKKN